MKPCPFCGCQDIDTYEGDYGNGVYCMNCGAMMGEQLHTEYHTRISLEQAREAWNTRVREVYVVMTSRNGYHRCYTPKVFFDEAEANTAAEEARCLTNDWGEDIFDKVWIEKWKLQ